MMSFHALLLTKCQQEFEKSTEGKNDDLEKLKVAIDAAKSVSLPCFEFTANLCACCHWIQTQNVIVCDTGVHTYVTCCVG